MPMTTFYFIPMGGTTTYPKDFPDSDAAIVYAQANDIDSVWVCRLARRRRDNEWVRVYERNADGIRGAKVQSAIETVLAFRKADRTDLIHKHLSFSYGVRRKGADIRAIMVLFGELLIPIGAFHIDDLIAEDWIPTRVEVPNE